MTTMRSSMTLYLAQCPNRELAHELCWGCNALGRTVSHGKITDHWEGMPIVRSSRSNEACRRKNSCRRPSGRSAEGHRHISRRCCERMGCPSTARCPVLALQGPQAASHRLLPPKDPRDVEQLPPQLRYLAMHLAPAAVRPRCRRSEHGMAVPAAAGAQARLGMPHRQRTEAQVARQAAPVPLALPPHNVTASLPSLPSIPQLTL
jgi:hypothetical protein